MKALSLLTVSIRILDMTSILEADEENWLTSEQIAHIAEFSPYSGMR